MAAATATIDIDPDTTKLAATLRVIAKHALACARELDVLGGRVEVVAAEQQQSGISSWGREQ